jgi:Mn2+/Fe2+ NRAMP family transporter
MSGISCVGLGFCWVFGVFVLLWLGVSSMVASVRALSFFPPFFFVPFVVLNKRERVGSSLSFERGRREVLVLDCVRWRVDGGTELWRPGSMFQSDWTDHLKLFELIVLMSQSNR